MWNELRSTFSPLKSIIKMHALILLIMSITSSCNNAHDEYIHDQLALKKVVDTFCNLADTKEVERQVLLFTSDATVTSLRNGGAGSQLQGRDQIKQAFAAFLDQFDVVFHQNGQHVSEIDGNSATAVSYATVKLIRFDDTLKTVTNFGIRYDDEFVKQKTIG